VVITGLRQVDPCHGLECSLGLGYGFQCFVVDFSSSVLGQVREPDVTAATYRVRSGGLAADSGRLRRGTNDFVVP